MKKLFITIAFVAAGFLASAQGLFVGGSLGLGTESGSIKAVNGSVSTETTQPKYFDFVIAPTVGFMFSDNMGVGIDLGFGFGKVTSKDETSDPVITTTLKTTEFGLAPYFRYVFAEVDNFKFYADARFEYSMSKPKATVEGGSTTITVEGDKTTAWGIGVVPGMAYMLTDNISINCALNVLSLGFSQEKLFEKDVDGLGTDVTTKTNNFGFGVNGATPVTIGFFYNF